jgi:hypothetical protein
MIDKAEDIYNTGKKSLKSLLREKSYSEVENNLEGKGINIDDVSDDDIESLVAAKTHDMTNNIKGIGIGTAFAMAISTLLGV